MEKKNSWFDADVARGERAARTVLHELGLKSPTETAIDNIAYMRGALVHDIPLRGAQGRLARLGGQATISVSNQIDYVPRRRFVVAHELGHFEIHKSVNQLELCDEGKIDELYDQGTEREANAFASELLMPTDLWRKRTDVKEPNLNVVSDLADEFSVSLVAASIRFAKLTDDRCCAVFVQNGVVQWAAYSSDFGYRIARWKRVDSYTVAYDCFTEGKTPTHRLETVSASAWIESHRIRDDDVIKEHCRPIRSINAAISLLWIPPTSDF